MRKKTIKAAYIDTFAPVGNIKVGQLPMPEVKEKEICLAVAYAGVNPADAKIAAGLFQSRLPHQFPLILGWEASGVVHAIGNGVSSFKVGDRVYAYCRKPLLQWGSWAEYWSFPAEDGALVPKNLSLAEAAAIPLAALTAWQALFDKAHLQPGEKVLIHGGGGGVGGFAIQWAKYHKAFVVTTASSPKSAYVKQLGADESIDYQRGSFVDQLRSLHPEGVDVVFDTVGKETYRQSYEVLKPGGRLVSLLEQPSRELMEKFSVQAEYLFVLPNGKQLQEIARIFEERKAKPPAIQQMPLDQASFAIEEIRKGRTKGKLVLQV